MPSPITGEFTVQMPLHGRLRDIAIPCYAPPDISPDQPSVLMLMGMGEEHPRAAHSATETLRDYGLTATSVILPFKDFSPDDMPWLVREAPVRIAQAWAESSEQAGPQQTAIAGNSRGGGVALIAASEAPEQFSAVAALAPAALSNRLSRYRKTRLALGLGIISPALQPPSLANIETGIHTMHELVRHALKGTLWEGLNYALSDELSLLALKGLQAMRAQGKPVRIFAGTRDPVFGARRSGKAIEQSGLAVDDVLTEVPGAHATVASRLGKEQLGVMGRWLAKALAHDKSF